MAYSDEAVVFEQSSVKVTALHFYAGNTRSYRLSEFRSAEAGHYEPRAVGWIGVIGGGALLMAIFDACAIASEMPVSEGYTGRSLSPIPPGIAWKYVAYVAAFGAIAILAFYMARYIWGRSIVRVETISGESRILFESRNRQLVESIVDAINRAVRPLGANSPRS